MEKKSSKEITIRIEGQQWEEAINKAFEKENEKVTLDGFRKGKAPKEVYLKKYGLGSLLMPAAELKFEDAYLKMLEENKDLEIVARPQGDIVKLEESGVEYRFVLTLRPEIKLGKYKNLKVTKPDIKVTKEEVCEELEKMKKQYAELVLKDGEAQLSDTVVIDFVGIKDGEEFEGGKAEGHSLELGSNSFIPGFEEKLVGSKAGDEKNIELEFPNDYPSEKLKGQKVEFKVTVKEVKTKKAAELNKDFFADLGMEGIDSEETLLAQLEENIQVRKQSDSENEYMTKLFDEAIANSEVEVPDAMINDEVERMLETYGQQLKMQGIKLEDYFQMTNTKKEDLEKMMQPEAMKRVQTRLLLEEIIKKENIETDEKQAHELLVEMADKYQMDKDELLKMYGGLEPLKYELKMRKAIDILKG